MILSRSGAVIAAAMACLALRAAAVTLTPDVAGVNGFTAVDKITWTDSKGLQREADFAKTHPTYATAKGYITRFVYQAGATTVTCDEPAVTSDLSGLCFTVDHNSSSVGWSNQKLRGENFSQSAQFAGAHHLDYRVTFNQLGDSANNPAKAYLITVDWSFADGVDHFIYSITYDCLGVTYPDDSRSPYSEFPWEGNNAGISNISGMSYGSDTVFMVPSLNASNAANSAFTFNKANLIPYVWEWVNTPSRECGYVQTQTWRQHKGGGGEWILTSTGTTLPDNWRLAYQMNSYQGYVGHRLTWGVDYGFLGTTGSAKPKCSWTTAVMLDQKSDSGVSKLIAETEKIQTTGGVVFTPLQGTVVAKGIKGPGDTASIAYSPLGFDYVYRCWRITADASNIARFTFNMPAGSYRSPVFAIEGYAGSALPTIVSRNGTTLASGTDYYASLDQTNHRLWVTLTATLAGSNTIGINSAQTMVRMPLTAASARSAVGSVKNVYTLTGKSVAVSALARGAKTTQEVFIVRQTMNGVSQSAKVVR